MPSKGQSITVCYAAFNGTTNAGVTGDAANHTIKLVKDGVEATATNASSEVDAANAPGTYALILTAAECNSNVVVVCGKSSTANVIIRPVNFTFEILPTSVPGASNGLLIVGSNTGTLTISDGVVVNRSTGNSSALTLSGNGTGGGIVANGGTTGIGATFNSGSSSGTGLLSISTNGIGAAFIGNGANPSHGIELLGGTNSSGLYAAGSGSGPGINALGGVGLSGTGAGLQLNGGGGSGAGMKIVTTAGDGVNITAGSGGVQFRSDITGNVSGSVNSVTSAVTATLTVQQAAAISGADIGSPGQLTIYRATTAVQAVTSVGSLTGRTKLWLTVKSTATYQNDASDTDSILQLTESGGLLILNGSSYGTPSDGSLVVTNDSNATVTLTLKPAATMLLLPGNYRYDIKADFSGVITEMAQGDFVTKATVTLAAS